MALTKTAIQVWRNEVTTTETITVYHEAVPEKTYTVTVTVPEVAIFIFEDDDGNIVTYTYYTGETITTTTTVVEPAKPAYYETITLTTTIPAGYYPEFEDGWTSGADSVGSLVYDGYYRFIVPSSSAGVMTGLTVYNITVEPTDIEYGVLFESGQYTVYERGIPQTLRQYYTDGDEFKIQRTGWEISYLLNDVVFYTSSKPATQPLVADASLYGGYDSISDEELVQEQPSMQGDFYFLSFDVYATDATLGDGVAIFDVFTISGDGDVDPFAGADFNLLKLKTLISEVDYSTTNGAYAAFDMVVFDIRGEEIDNSIIISNGGADFRVASLLSEGYGPYAEPFGIDEEITAFTVLASETERAGVIFDLLSFSTTGFDADLFSTSNAFKVDVTLPHIYPDLNFVKDKNAFELDVTLATVVPELSFSTLQLVNINGLFVDLTFQPEPRLDIDVTLASVTPELTFVGSATLEVDVTLNSVYSDIQFIQPSIVILPGMITDLTFVSGGTVDVDVILPSLFTEQTFVSGGYYTLDVTLNSVTAVNVGVSIDVTLPSILTNLRFLLDNSSDLRYAYAMNVNSTGHTKFTSFSFDRLFRFQGKQYAVFNGLLYELNFNTPNFDSMVRTFHTNFGTPDHKQIPTIYLDVEDCTGYVTGLNYDNRIQYEFEAQVTKLKQTGRELVRTGMFEGEQGNELSVVFGNYKNSAPVLHGIEIPVRSVGRKV